MMNKIKAIKQLMMILFLMVSFNALAETAPFKVFEAISLNIKLSQDGTGIVKDVYCRACKFRVVKITSNSRATANGVEVNILEANTRAGKSAMVSFNPDTREVQYIRW